MFVVTKTKISRNLFLSKVRAFYLDLVPKQSKRFEEQYPHPPQILNVETDRVREVSYGVKLLSILGGKINAQTSHKVSCHIENPWPSQVKYSGWINSIAMLMKRDKIPKVISF